MGLAAVQRAENTRRTSASQAVRRKWYNTLERTWARPTFEVNGLLSASPARAPRRCCPRSRWRRSACGSCGQDRTRSRSIQAYVEKVTPKTVELKVTRMQRRQAVETRSTIRICRPRPRIEKGFGRSRSSPGKAARFPSYRFRGARSSVGAVRGGSARRERARTEREARPVELPQRHHRSAILYEENQPGS